MKQYFLTRIGPIGLVEQADGAARKVIFRGTYKEAQRFYKNLLRRQQENQPPAIVPEHT